MIKMKSIIDVIILNFRSKIKRVKEEESKRESPW